MGEKVLHTIMRELCIEMDIEMKKMSYDWVLQFRKDGKIRYVLGNKLDLNTEASGAITGDKYATFEVLRSQNISVIEHIMIFKPNTRMQYVDNMICDKIVRAFNMHHCLVVKPNHGCEGVGVTLCCSLQEINETIHQLFIIHDSVSVCPFYDIKTEYRAFYLNNEVLLIYCKQKPFVIGNGIATLNDLITALHLPDKSVVQENLNRIDLSYIPKKGERVEISWKYNLSGGATPEILQKGEVYNKLETLAIATGKALNLQIAVIDIIETSNDQFYVLEVNSGMGVTLFIESVNNGYEIIKDIYRKAMKKMFE